MPNKAGAAAVQVTTTPTAEWRSFKWIDPKVLTFRARDGADVYARLFTPEMIGAQTRSVARRRRLRPRRGLRAERAPLLVELLPRVHVPQSAGLARLCGPRRRLPRQLRLRARLAYRHLSPHGRQGSRGHRRRGEVPGGERAGQPEADWRLRRELRRLHHADGDVHDAGRLCSRRGASPGDRLGALQPRLHVEHPQRAAGRRRSVQTELADLFRRWPQGSAPHLPRNGRHQRALSGFGASRRAADRVAQGELGAGGVPGRESRVRAGDQLDGRIQDGS